MGLLCFPPLSFSHMAADADASSCKFQAERWDASFTQSLEDGTWKHERIVAHVPFSQQVVVGTSLVHCRLLWPVYLHNNFEIGTCTSLKYLRTLHFPHTYIKWHLLILCVFY